MPTAYKVVKVIENGDRVSVIVPNWNPLYKVYQHQGINQIVNEGMVFKTRNEAIDWASGFNKYFENPNWWDELKLKEKLEVWEVEYENKIPERRGFLINIIYQKDKFDCHKNSFLKKIKNGFPQMMEYARKNLTINEFNFYTFKIQRSALVVSNIKLIEKIDT